MRKTLNNVFSYSFIVCENKLSIYVLIIDGSLDLTGGGATNFDNQNGILN
jgi:hypothetical protein